MSSPWNPYHNPSPPMPGGDGMVLQDRRTGTETMLEGGIDEWDLLRAAPDYDIEEMRGVSLPSAFPAVCSTLAHAPVGVGTPWAPAPQAPPWSEPLQELRQDWPPQTSQAPNGGSPPLTPPDRWPEAAEVASLAGDLYTRSEVDLSWRQFAPTTGPYAFTAAEPRGTDWGRLLGWDGAPSSGEAEPGGISEAWAFLPDTMLQESGDRDLLDEALQAGRRAGLLSADVPGDARCRSREATPQGTASCDGVAAAHDGGRDLLDAALAAGERAGLLRR